MAAAMTFGGPRDAATSHAERRRFRRIGEAEQCAAAGARLRPGRDVSILNVSRGGACVEAASRVLPDTRVELQVTLSAWRWAVGAHVLRCHVSALVEDQGARYRAALQFERLMDADVEAQLHKALVEMGGEGGPRGYQVPIKGHRDPAALGTIYPERGTAL